MASSSQGVSPSTDHDNSTVRAISNEQDRLSITEVPQEEPEQEQEHDGSQSSVRQSNVSSTAPAATGGETRLKRTKAELTRITLNFTPSWFSICMGTGIVSILLYTLPYQFKGLQIIADIIFALNVFLFLLFLAISIARYTIWPNIWFLMLFHPGQSLFLGTFSMGMSTIVNMCALSLVPFWGHTMQIFTWVLWWINSVIALIICIGLPFLQFTRHQQSIDNITGIWMLPVVSTIVSAASGGIVAETLSNPSHVRLTLIVSWILLGTGFSFACFLMALYYLRLAIYKIPPAALIVSAFLPVGPCGQGSFALLKISSTLWNLQHSTGQALVPSMSVADSNIMATSIYSISLVGAFLVWGMGLVWLTLAIMIIIDLWVVSDLKFNLGWWGFTFPIGVFATAAIQMGNELNSTAFKVIGTILAVVVLLLWLVVGSLTIKQAIKGQIFFSPCLAEVGGQPPEKVPEKRKYQYEPREDQNKFNLPTSTPGR
ncbi:unnamed protein product [Sympodiomycopsis kandeliae]